MSLFSLDGKILDEFDAYSAKNGQLDYRAEGKRSGAVELKGKRLSQEDRMFDYEFDKEVAEVFNALTLEQQEGILEETFKILNENIKKDVPDIQRQGSTAIVAIVFPKQKRVLSASLGDSQIFSVLLDEHNAVKEVKELNEIHQPFKPSERERLADFAKSSNILESDCVSSGGRLGGRLAVSGAFGDLDYLKYGLRHNPDIKDECFKLEKNERLFIIVSCDGLTEHDLVSLRDIGDIIATHNEKSLGTLATILAQKAYKRGSSDNISVQITQMAENLAEGDERPFMFGVFDGHGGSSVSQYLKNKFVSSFIFALAVIEPNLLDKLKNRQDSTPSTPVLDEDTDDTEEYEDNEDNDVSLGDVFPPLMFTGTVLGKREAPQWKEEEQVSRKKARYQ